MRRVVRASKGRPIPSRYGERTFQPDGGPFRLEVESAAKGEKRPTAGPPRRSSVKDPDHAAALAQIKQSWRTPNEQAVYEVEAEALRQGLGRSKTAVYHRWRRVRVFKAHADMALDEARRGWRPHYSLLTLTRPGGVEYETESLGVYTAVFNRFWDRFRKRWPDRHFYFAHELQGRKAWHSHLIVSGGWFPKEELMELWAIVEGCGFGTHHDIRPITYVRRDRRGSSWDKSDVVNYCSDVINYTVATLNELGGSRVGRHMIFGVKGRVGKFTSRNVAVRGIARAMRLGKAALAKELGRPPKFGWESDKALRIGLMILQERFPEEFRAYKEMLARRKGGDPEWTTVDRGRAGP